MLAGPFRSLLYVLSPSYYFNNRDNIIYIVNSTYEALKYPQNFAELTQQFIQSGAIDRWTLAYLFNVISSNSALGQSYENQFEAGRLFGNLTIQYMSFANGSS